MRLALDDLTAHDDEVLRSRALAAFPKFALWLLKHGRGGVELSAGFEAWLPVLDEICVHPREPRRWLMRYATWHWSRGA